MRAAVYTGKAGPLTVIDVDVPAIGNNDALVRVAACGVCTTEVAHSLLGLPTFKQPEVILGHEVSGVVAETGANVSGVRVNDRVLLPILFPCHECPDCRRGRDNICAAPQVLGNVIDGGFAEYVRVPARDLVQLPADLPLEDACILTDVFSTPFHAVHNRARVRPGENVVVLGTGSLGINVVQFCAQIGANVIAVDVNVDKLETALRLGASHAVQSDDEVDIIAEVRKIIDGPADVAFEVTGRSELVQRTIDAVLPGGRACVIGVPMENSTINVAAAVMNEVELSFAFGCPTSEYEKIVRIVAAGKLGLSELITERYGLDDINKAVQAVAESRGFKHIVIPYGPRHPDTR